MTLCHPMPVEKPWKVPPTLDQQTKGQSVSEYPCKLKCNRERTCGHENAVQRKIKKDKEDMTAKANDIRGCTQSCTDPAATSSAEVAKRKPCNGHFSIKDTCACRSHTQSIVRWKSISGANHHISRRTSDIAGEFV